MPTSPTYFESRSLEVPGAELYFELRGEGPLTLLIGAPMRSDAFTLLADLLATKRSVLTTDPRGIGRSTVDDRDADSTPELRAADLAHLIEHVDRGPATVFGSSGGAVTALALTQTRPDLLQTVIAHEPPLNELLDERQELRKLTQEMCERYLDGDVIGAWTMFFKNAGISIPDEAIQQMFGGERDPQEVADERYWFAHELRPSTWWQPNIELLHRHSRDIELTIGIGEDSAGQECDRTSRALCKQLGKTPVHFPGGHTGFIRNTEEFAAQLEKLL